MGILNDKVVEAGKIIDICFKDEDLYLYTGKFDLIDECQYVWFVLKELGVYVDDDDSHNILLSNECKEGDARRIFCEKGPKSIFLEDKITEPARIPIPRFKQIWKILKKPISSIPIDYTVEQRAKNANSVIEKEIGYAIDHIISLVHKNNILPLKAFNYDSSTGKKNLAIEIFINELSVALRYQIFRKLPN
ncbi:MAG: hypothetical protein AABY32_00635 [Nanoarchaeota archaeon]